MPTKEKHPSKNKNFHPTAEKTADSVSPESALHGQEHAVPADASLTPGISLGEPPAPAKTKLDLLIDEINATEIRRPTRSTHLDVVHGLEPFYKPQAQEPGLVVWKHLQYPVVERLNSAEDHTAIRSILSECFALLDDDTNPHHAIVLDLYCQVIRKATEMQLDFPQTSSFFGIIHEIHSKMLETPVDNFVECLKYLDALLAHHVIKRPPWSARIFSEQQAKEIREFAIRNYFRYFHMYKHVFTPTVVMDLAIDYQRTEQPAHVAELDALTFDNLTITNPVTQEPLSLEEILREVDMEDEGRPIPPAAAPNKPTNDQPKTEPDVTALPSTDAQVVLTPQMTELEKVIAAQVDIELKHLRERLGSKLQQVDEILASTLGTGAVSAALANDPFAHRESAPPEPDTKKGKKKAK